MDIALTPNIYTPSIDNNGNYIDTRPIMVNDITCPCSKKGTIFKKSSHMCAHFKTKTHIKWIEQINNNKSNFYTENIKNKELIENQQKIIARLETQLLTKQNTIDYMATQLMKYQDKNHNIIQVD